MLMRLRTTRILELDGLRAFAVMVVVLHHMINFSGVVPGINTKFKMFLAHVGTGGVYIFFVISGLIITSLLIEEFKIHKRVSLPKFYIRRFFRIIPPFACYLIVLFALCQVGYISVKPINFLWSSLFITNSPLFENPTESSGWFVCHTWSLSVEEQYYLLLAPITTLLLGYQKIINIFLVTLFCSCTAAFFLAKTASFYINTAFISLSVLNQFKYIIAGVIMALHQRPIRQYLSNQPRLLPIALIVILLLPWIINLPPILKMPLSVAEPFCYSLLILWCIENPEKCTILRWKFIQWIGRCSYSIYLWQQLFTGKPGYYTGPNVVQLPIALFCIVTCAGLSYYLIERPSIRLSKYFAPDSIIAASQK